VDTKRFLFLSSRKLPWPERQFLPYLAPDLKSGLHHGRGIVTQFILSRIDRDPTSWTAIK